MALAVLAKAGAFDCPSCTIHPTAIANSLQDFIICFEMMIISLVHREVCLCGMSGCRHSSRVPCKDTPPPPPGGASSFTTSPDHPTALFLKTALTAQLSRKRRRRGSSKLGLGRQHLLNAVVTTIFSVP